MLRSSLFKDFVAKPEGNSKDGGREGTGDFFILRSILRRRLDHKFRVKILAGMRGKDREGGARNPQRPCQTLRVAIASAHIFPGRSVGQPN